MSGRDLHGGRVGVRRGTHRGADLPGQHPHPLLMTRHRSSHLREQQLQRHPRRAHRPAIPAVDLAAGQHRIRIGRRRCGGGAAVRRGQGDLPLTQPVRGQPRVPDPLDHLPAVLRWRPPTRVAHPVDTAGNLAGHPPLPRPSRRRVVASALIWRVGSPLTWGSPLVPVMSSSSSLSTQLVNSVAIGALGPGSRGYLQCIRPGARHIRAELATHADKSPWNSPGQPRSPTVVPPLSPAVLSVIMPHTIPQTVSFCQHQCFCFVFISFCTPDLRN